MLLAPFYRIYGFIQGICKLKRSKIVSKTRRDALMLVFKKKEPRDEVLFSWFLEMAEFGGIFVLFMQEIEIFDNVFRGTSGI